MISRRVIVASGLLLVACDPASSPSLPSIVPLSSSLISLHSHSLHGRPAERLLIAFVHPLLSGSAHAITNGRLWIRPGLSADSARIARRMLRKPLGDALHLGLEDAWGEVEDPSALAAAVLEVVGHSPGHEHE